MQLIKTLLITSVLCAALTATQACGGVVFTNLIFFTYTNAPHYGWNFGTPNGRTSALAQGNDGNFYGTTFEGGLNHFALGPADQLDTYGYGTVFKMSPSGTFTSLYSFGSVNIPDGNADADGRGPVGNLMRGADGNLYGTTGLGGGVPGDSNGTIFQISTNGVLTTLYSFGSQGYTGNFVWPDGRFPDAGLVQGSDGNFYGTTTDSGTNGVGTVFQLTPGGMLSTLYSFSSPRDNPGDADGYAPYGELMQGTDGNFYGTTAVGGNYGGGTVFKISPMGAFTPLTQFSGTNGWSPYAGLTLGTDGNFYGTTSAGGPGALSGLGAGIIFRMTTNGVFTVLYYFTGLGDGAFPHGGLIQGSDGNFYGTTAAGGNLDGNNPNGAGTVFQITTNGTLTTLYAFTGPDGQEPQGALVQGNDGSFYGTTSYGGLDYDPSNPSITGYGTIFQIVIPPAFQAMTQVNGALDITWSVMPGQRYQIQQSANLSEPDWLNLGSSVTASNTVACVSAFMTNSQSFYRVMLLR